MVDEPPATRWSTATSGVRSAAAWLATTAGATAAVVFGAGPIIDSEVDAADWGALRWLLTILLAGVGAAAVLYVISRLLVLQLPIEITLDALPPNLRSRIEGNQLSEYLPGDAQDLADFKARLQAYANAAVSLETEAAATTDAQEKARLTRLAAIQKSNCDIYKAKRAELYELAAYEIEWDRLSPRATKPWFYLGGAAILALVAMVAFTLVTGSGASESEPEEAVETPVLGEMTAKQVGADLWERLALGECVIGGVVPVVVFEAEAESYTVQTLGSPAGCGRYRMTIPTGLVTLVEVKPVSVAISEE